MATKFDVTLGFPENDTRHSLDLEGVTFDGENLTEQEAEDAFIESIRDNIEVNAVEASYSVELTLTATITFTFDDENGDYVDEDDVQAAVEREDILWADYVSHSDLELSIESVEVSEA